jgi:ATP-dependent protease Clp ATPase subunit
VSRENRCSFCGKKQSSEIRLIAGPGVFICNQCVGLCNEILAHEASHHLTSGDGPGKPAGADHPTVRAVSLDTASRVPTG